MSYYVQNWSHNDTNGVFVNNMFVFYPYILEDTLNDGMKLKVFIENEVYLNFAS